MITYVIMISDSEKDSNLIKRLLKKGSETAHVIDSTNDRVKSLMDFL